MLRRRKDGPCDGGLHAAAVPARMLVASIVRWALANPAAATGVRFVLVGGMNALIYVAVLFLLSGWVGLRPGFGAAVAYVVGMLTSFVGHRTFTFGPSAKSLGTEIYRFVGAHVAVLLLVATYSEFAKEVLGWSLTAVAIMGVLLAPAASFVLLRWWVFRPTTVESP